MSSIVRRVVVAMLMVAGVSALGVGPANACSLAVTPYTVDGKHWNALGGGPIAVRVGDRLRIQGRGFYEIVPSAELPSTTSTTRPDGLEVADCPSTRPASSVSVGFNQAPHETVELATVSGDVVDVEVVIPSSAVPGPAILSAGSGPEVKLNVLAGPLSTTRPNDLPRTGSGAWPTAGTGLVLVLGGAALVRVGRRRRTRVG